MVRVWIFENVEAAPRGVAYASGANEAGQIVGHAENGEAFGISAQECGKPCLGALVRAARESQSKIFVDSGVYSQVGAGKRIDFGKVIKLQEYVAGLYGRRALIVAPDVLGDADATLAKLAEYREPLRQIQKTGASVLVAVQDFDDPRGFWAKVRKILPGAVPGWPSTKRAQKLQRAQAFEDFVSTVPRVHLLGLGTRGRLFGVPYSRALAELPAGLEVSTDANERRRQVRRSSGFGRVTVVEDIERGELARTDDLGEELIREPLVADVAKMAQWQSADNPATWWWAYIAGADPGKNATQNTNFFRSNLHRLTGYSRPVGELRRRLGEASGRWLQATVPSSEEDVRAFAADPIGELERMTGPDSDGELLEPLADAYRDLQLRMSAQEVKRRGVKRIRKTMEEPLVVVGCGKEKQERSAKAADLYTGGVFKAHKEIADRYGGLDFVASAKLGLIRGDRVVDPYDLTMTDLTAAQRRAWAQKVARRVCRLADEKRRKRPVLALVGKAYAGWVPIARECGVEVFTPLEGLMAGERRKAARLLREGATPPPMSVSWVDWVRSQ